MEVYYRELFLDDWDLRFMTQKSVPYYYFLFIWNFIFLMAVPLSKVTNERNDPICFVRLIYSQAGLVFLFAIGAIVISSLAISWTREYNSMLNTTGYLESFDMIANCIPGENNEVMSEAIASAFQERKLIEYPVALISTSLVSLLLSQFFWIVLSIS